MKTERLIHMANQIADFFAAHPREQAVAGVADHLEKFWDPRMRMALVTYAEAGGDGLRELVTAAIPNIKVPPG
jgi:formate dehydrogenase subunit delta